MKIKKQIIIYALITYSTIFYSYFDETFDQDFYAEMKALRQQLEIANHNLVSDSRKMHDALFQEWDKQTKGFPLMDNFQNSKTVQAYQQSSSSLSFAHNEKAIKIEEKKDNAAIIYTIIITDKYDIKTDKKKEQDQDAITQLKEIRTYIKKNFSSKNADKILQNCIDAISHKNKSDIINMQVLQDKNQTKYSIEIAHKKEASQYNMETNIKKKKNKKEDSSRFC